MNSDWILKLIEFSFDSQWDFCNSQLPSPSLPWNWGLNQGCINTTLENKSSAWACLTRQIWEDWGLLEHDFGLWRHCQLHWNTAAEEPCLSVCLQFGPLSVAGSLSTETSSLCTSRIMFPAVSMQRCLLPWVFIVNVLSQMLSEVNRFLRASLGIKPPFILQFLWEMASKDQMPK